MTAAVALRAAEREPFVAEESAWYKPNETFRTTPATNGRLHWARQSNGAEPDEDELPLIIVDDLY
jgi:hypothetical protein